MQCWACFFWTTAIVLIRLYFLFYFYFVSVYQRIIGTYARIRLFCPYTSLIQVTWAYYGTLEQKFPVKLGVSKCDVNTITNLMKKMCNGRRECWVFGSLKHSLTPCYKFPSTSNLVLRYSCIQETKPGNVTSNRFEFQELKPLNTNCNCQKIKSLCFEKYHFWCFIN